MPTDPHPYRVILIINIVLLFVILLGGMFALGMRTGTYRCLHQSARYLRQAGFPQDMIREPHFMGRGMMRFPMMHDGHGIAGEVLSFTEDTVVVLGRDGTERTLLLGSGTKIGNPRNPQTIDDITVGCSLIGFGRPDADGAVQAWQIVVVPGAEADL